MKIKSVVIVFLLISAISVWAQHNAGDVWMIPVEQAVNTGDLFTTELHINTGTQKIGAFNFNFTFNEHILSLYANPRVINVIPAGVDYVISSSMNGYVIISGFNASGIGPGTDIHLLTINWKAERSGASYIETDIDTLTDDSYNNLPAGTVTNGVVHVLKTAPLQGDVNSDRIVNIVDALMIAQYGNGSNPYNFNTSVADVNCDGKINIVDALITAQYYIGILLSFPCTIPQPTPPATQVLIDFTDPVFEKNIRMAIDKLTGDVYNTDVYAVEELILSNSQITDITGLEHFTSLKTLYLSFNSISDITPLAGLTKLTTLSLVWNKLSDITPLAGLKALVSLYLYKNTITDISPLAGLTNLLNLELDQNAISDLTPLAGLTLLRSLNLEENQVTDIAPLRALTRLRSLMLGTNAITDISPLSGMLSLTTLELARNKIGSIAPLAGLTRLTNLEMSVNAISDITALSGLTNLVYLYGDGNTISNLVPLTRLIKLERLSLGSNLISDVSPLSPLTALTYLYLSSNRISDVEPLTTLGNVVQMYLEGNPIREEDIAMLKAALPNTSVNF